MTDIQIPDISLLRRIKVISDLSEDHLIALANQLMVFTARDGELLISKGSTEKTSLYVIRGRVSLIAPDDKTKIISVDETDEISPIAQLRPCIYDVKAIGRVDYLKIDRQTLVDYAELSEAVADDISVHSLFTNYDDEDNSIVSHLYHNLMDKSISLPSLPSVADRMQKIYKGKSTSLDSMVQLLTSYPDVSRKINNVARIAKKSDLSATEKIRRSIRHLGILKVYCLIMTYAVGKLVNRLPDEHMQRVSSFWDHSLNVAALSRILAKKTGSFPPDLAMLAGLVHGIGVLVIDDRLLDHRDLMLDHLEIDHAIQVMRPEISSLLLRKWNFDDELILAAEECGEWQRKPESPADLCDLILVANYYSMMQSDRKHTLPQLDSVPAIEKLGITPEQSIEVIKESAIVRKNIQKIFA
ncbi:MAG: HDOD domain-containing protein [Gammaproteobacteria bacterium]|nr:HDOD domain-containing protein [Gammaproteobacteria bacterium]